LWTLGHKFSAAITAPPDNATAPEDVDATASGDEESEFHDTNEGIQSVLNSSHSSSTSDSNLDIPALLADFPENPQAADTMARDHRDPRDFIPKTAAPTFDIETQRDGWRTWKRQWNAWLGTSGINKLRTVDPANAPNPAISAEMDAAVKSIKVDCLIIAFQEPTLRVLDGLNLSAAQWADADEVIASLEAHVDGGTNKRVYRTRLAQRVRSKEEDIDSFVIALRDYASVKAKYVAMATAADNVEDHLLDAFIANINDTEITEKLLQLDDTKSFGDAVALAKAIWTSRIDTLAITGPSPATTARYYSCPGPRQSAPAPPGPPPQAQQLAKQKHKRPNGGPKCNKCGYAPHTDGKTCPGERATCRHCNETGHYDRCCPSRPRTNMADGDGGSVGAVILSGTLPRASYIATTSDKRAADYSSLERLEPLSTIPVGTSTTREAGHNSVIQFLPDTGANLTCLPASVLRRMNLPLHRLSNKTMQVPSPVLADGKKGSTSFKGTFRGTLTFQDRTFETDVYVYEGLAQPILARKACFRLNIVTSEVVPESQPF
jgi:hypothetical protein